MPQDVSAKEETVFAMTECTQSRLPFANHGSREVVAEFSGGTITSDSGALLLRETDGRMKLLARFSQCFLDARNPVFVQHPVEQMLAQRVLVQIVKLKQKCTGLFLPKGPADGPFTY